MAFLQHASTATLLAQASHEARQVLSWALEAFEDEVVLGVSRDLQGLVLLDLCRQARRTPPVVLLDEEPYLEGAATQLEFIEAHLGVQARRVHGDALPWPGSLRASLGQARAWITGADGAPGRPRDGVEIISWDREHRLIRVQPLASWSRRDALDYVERHGLSPGAWTRGSGQAPASMRVLL